jgi:hypothetical protein
MKVYDTDEHEGRPVPREHRPELDGDPVEITERERLVKPSGEVVRPYFVNMMEMRGCEDFDGQSLNLKWRADAINPRTWASCERPFAEDPSLVCDLADWR